jgi:hypothetical protein
VILTGFLCPQWESHQFVTVNIFIAGTAGVEVDFVNNPLEKAEYEFSVQSNACKFENAAASTNRTTAIIFAVL